MKRYLLLLVTLTLGLMAPRSIQAQQLDLACPAGFHVMPTVGTTLNVFTGNGKQWLCYDDAGDVNATLLNSTIINPIVNGLACNGTTNDTVALQNLITLLGSSVATIQFPANQQCLIGDITIPANLGLDFFAQGALKCVTGQTVTILGPVLAATQEIFFNCNSGTTGTVDFTGNAQVTEVFPEWWGAAGSASASTNLVGLQNAIYGAFGCGPVITCRTNANGLYKWNKTLRLTSNYQINGQLNMYHTLNFIVRCNGRLNSGITQTVNNTEIIDGQSNAYGVFYDCAWSTQNSQDVNHPLMSLDYNASQGVDLATQFIDFYNNNWQGSGLAAIGFEVARSGGGAQGSNIHFYDNAAAGFTEAAYMLGQGSNQIPTQQATNAIEIQWIGGDIQGCPNYGIESFGAGSILIEGTSFENGFATQTGYDAWLGYAPAGEWNVINGVRSESRRLIGGNTAIRINDSFVIDQASQPGQGQTPALGQIIEGSFQGGDGKYYKVTVQGAMGGLGSASIPSFRTASAGSATTITDSVGGLTVNAYIGFQVTIMTGTAQYEYCIITSNTASVITCTGGWQTKFTGIFHGPPFSIVNPDNTSQFIVEPNWGTQFTSGGATWVALNEQWVEAYFVADNIFVPGDQLSADYRSRVTNSHFTRSDWAQLGAAFGPASINQIQNDLVIDQNNTNMSYRTWGIPHPDAFTGQTGYSFHFLGGLPLCWGTGITSPLTTEDDICLNVNGTGTLFLNNNSSGAVKQFSFTKTGIFTAPGATVGTTNNTGTLNIGTDGAVNLFRNANNNLTINTTGGAGLTIAAAGAGGLQVNGAGGLQMLQGNFAFAQSKGQHSNTFAAQSDHAGVATCAANTVTVTFTTTYTSTPVIVVSDETAAGGARVSAKAAGSFTITCSGATDVVDYITVGNPN